MKNGPLKNLAEVKGGLLAHDKSAEQYFTEFGEGQPTIVIIQNVKLFLTEQLDVKLFFRGPTKCLVMITILNFVLNAD